MEAISRFLLLGVLCGCFPAWALPLYAQQETGALSTPTQGSSMMAGSETGDGSLDNAGGAKYQIGSGDLIDVRVFGEPQFNGPIEVDEYGNVEIPFVEEPIYVRCRTVREVRAAVAKALSKFLVKPQVNVAVPGKNKTPAVVYGAVRAPQRVKMNRPARLLEVLANAGGVTEQAGGDVQVFHTEEAMCPLTAEEGVEAPPPPLLPPAEQQATEVAKEEATTDKQQKTTALSAEQQTAKDALQVRYDIFKLADIKLGKQESNPIIQPGDIVLVLEAAPIYLTGNVVAPQGIYLREQMSLMSAIAMVGGLRDDAKENDIRIYRKQTGTLEPEVIRVNYTAIKKKKQPDVALQAYDVIDVNDTLLSRKSIVKTLLGGAIGSAVSGVAGGVGAYGANLPLRVLY